MLLIYFTNKDKEKALKHLPAECFFVQLDIQFF